MPCNSDYLEANYRERELSKVACLLDELDGKQIDKCHWKGYHPDVYGKTIDGDSLVANLCSRLQDLDVTNYSLEMQIWWRDHQEADKERLQNELQQKVDQHDRNAALAKLTDHEKRLLGIQV